MARIFLRNFVIALGLWAGITPLASIAGDQTLHFGIVPQQAASRLAKIWVPFMDELSNRTNLSIKFATMKDIPAFEQCLTQGDYDISYMNPYHYTVFSERSGYRAIAHQTEKKLKGILVVRKDAPYQIMQDLDNQKLAFPSPAAFGASVIPRAEMKANGLNIEPIYVKSHDSVYKLVVAGLFPAGGGVLRTFNSIPPELKDQLRVVYSTAGYTPHAFAVAPHLDGATVKEIATAMAQIALDQPDLVKAIGMNGFQSASDKDWDDVRGLKLTQEQTEIAQKGGVRCRFD